MWSFPINTQEKLSYIAKNIRQRVLQYCLEYESLAAKMQTVPASQYASMKTKTNSSSLQYTNMTGAGASIFAQQKAITSIQ